MGQAMFKRIQFVCNYLFSVLCMAAVLQWVPKLTYIMKKESTRNDQEEMNSMKHHNPTLNEVNKI